MSQEITYLDESENVVTDKRLARRFIVRELDEQGGLVEEMFGEIDEPEPEPASS